MMSLSVENVKRLFQKDLRGEDQLERAREIATGRAAHTRYKILTLKQLRKWKHWQDPGKAMGEKWDDGERVLAFEDGTVVFANGGGAMQDPFKDPEDMAGWIEFLDRSWVEWQ